MRKIYISFDDSWRKYEKNLSDDEKDKLKHTIIYEYDNNTTFKNLISYLNKENKELIIKYSQIEERKINYKKNMKEIYRIHIIDDYIYIFDLNTKIMSFVKSFKTNKFLMFYTFFGELGGKVANTSGMKFYIYSKELGKHHLPHVHVKYQGEEVVIDLQGNILEGSIKKNKQNMAIEIVRMNRNSFLLKWNDLTDAEKYSFINNELTRII